MPHRTDANVKVVDEELDVLAAGLAGRRRAEDDAPLDTPAGRGLRAVSRGFRRCARQGWKAHRGEAEVGAGRAWGPQRRQRTLSAPMEQVARSRKLATLSSSASSAEGGGRLCVMVSANSAAEPPPMASADATSAGDENTCAWLFASGGSGGGGGSAVVL